LGDQLVIRFAGKHSEPQQIVALAQQGKSLDTISAKHLQQALLYLPQLLNNNATGPSNNPEPPTRISSSMADLEFTAKRLAYALGQKGEVDLLRACLQEPDFQQSPLRKSVIHNLLRFDTSGHNYKLSRETHLPESISDYASMSNKTVDRNLQEYISHLHIDPETLQGKRILLIGGGRSPIRRDLEELEISAHITNVDKFYRDYDSSCEHTKIGDDFNSRAVDTHLAQNKYDEIWALFFTSLR